MTKDTTPTGPRRPRKVAKKVVKKTRPRTAAEIEAARRAAAAAPAGAAGAAGAKATAAGAAKAKPVKKVVKKTVKKAAPKAGAAGAAAGAKAKGTGKGNGNGNGAVPAGVTARARRKSRWSDPAWRKKALAVVAALFAVMLLVPIAAFGTAYMVTKVPQPEELTTNQISYIMAADDNTELARIVPPEGNRQNVDLNEIPLPVRNAVLAAEDRNFYTNPGFSITGFARAALGQLTGSSGAGGGSTITQQYVKNALVGNEHSIQRKAKELVISAKMAREWSKDEILGAYLNTIYFGRGAYGISAASHAYFNKPVQELTPEEGAVLAASIQAPSALDPWTNRQAAETRWNYVLDGMVEIGAMPAAERAAATYPEVMDPALTADTNTPIGTNGLIKSKVLAELSAAGISEEQVNTGGLRITTTIDPVAQQAAVDNAHAGLDGQRPEVRAAVVSIDPKSGAVRAYYGGDDPVGFDFASAGLQTGSTFKIFGLAAYLAQGGSIYDAFDSSPVTTGDTVVNNVDGQSCGTCSIAQALKMSLNTSFIRLARQLEKGPQDVADMAHRLGVSEEMPGIGKTLTENGGTPYEGIILGQYQTSPLDMASALATLSNSGKYYRPHFVQRVVNADGEVLLDNADLRGDQVVEPGVADDVMAAMAPIAAYSNGNVLAGGRASAAKTGTAQLGDTGSNKDAWMIGSTPQLATAVWMGSTDNQPLTTVWGGSMYGSNTPATIWKNTMDAALEGKEFENFSTSGSASGGYTGSSGSYSGGYVAPAPAAPQVETLPEPEPAPEPAPVPIPAPPAGGADAAQELGNLLEQFLGN